MHNYSTEPAISYAANLTINKSWEIHSWELHPRSLLKPHLLRNYFLINFFHSSAKCSINYYAL